MVENPGTRPPRRRRLLFVAGAALGLLLLAVLLLPLFVDVETFREPIQDAIESATGWNAELGAMELSLWGGAALVVSPARLAAPDDSSAVEIDSIAVDVALLPLLSGRLEVRDVGIDGPRLTLLRDDAEDGWVLPLLPPPDEGAVADPESGGGDAGFQVDVRRIRLRRGSMHVEDRTTDPPLVLDLENVSATLLPSSGEVSGSAEIGGTEGRVAWSGDLERGLSLELEALPTELLHPWVGAELVHGGGTLSGAVQVRMPLALAGELHGDGVTLLSGERPFREGPDVEFALATEDDTWTLERLAVRADEVLIEGRGRLLPELDLELQIPETALAALLEATEAILPLPLELDPPGRVSAEARVRQPTGGELSYEAAGVLTAAAFKIDPMLPPARDVRTEFTLDRSGLLEVRILDGRVGGGPLTGVARVNPVYPPGTLTFDGGLQDAVLGQLLGGLVADAPDKISGPTGLTAKMGIDLGREQIDARAITGTLELDARQVSVPGWDIEGAIRRRLEEKLGDVEKLAALLGGKNRAQPTATPEAGSDGLEELFDSVAARIDFDRWPWGLENLSLDTGHLAARGDGTFDPGTGAVEVAVSARLDEKRTAELVRRYSQLKVLVDKKGRLTLPVEIGGTLTAPSVKADLGRALDAELGEEPEERVKGLLRGLLDRDDD
jgi:hypothetical protein